MPTVPTKLAHDDTDLIRGAFAEADRWAAAGRDSSAGTESAGTGIPSGSPSTDSGSPSTTRHWKLATTPLPSVPGFSLIRETHRGGQGIVYEAVQLSTDRIVAVKFMLAGPLAGAIDRARFDREVRILARLQHPGIVNIYDTGVAGGCRYFVMDYIAGQPIDEYVQSAGLDTRATLELFARVCDIVFAAHVRGFIHRDLKPSHILIDDDGQPHIVDFGLGKIIEPDNSCQLPVVSFQTDAIAATDTRFAARPGVSSGSSSTDNRQLPADRCSAAGTGIPSGSSTTDSRQLTTDNCSRTQTGQFIGSLAWASPEQAAGRHDDLDTRTDVYSLGVILYYVLTERFPYSVEGDPRAVLDRIIRDAPIPPRNLASDPRIGRPVVQRSALRFLDPLIPRLLDPVFIDDEVDSILLKCLSKDPAHRYQSAGDLAAELRRHLSGETIEAKRDDRWYLLKKFTSKHRALIGITAGVIASALIVWCHEKRRADDTRVALESKVEEGRRAFAMSDWLAALQSSIRSKTAEAIGANASLARRMSTLATVSFSDPEIDCKIHLQISELCLLIPDYSAAAVLHAERALAAAKELTPLNDDLLQRSHQQLGHAVVADQPRRALALQQDALAVALRAHGDHSQEYLGALERVADAYRACGDHHNHERAMSELIALARQIAPEALGYLFKRYAEWLCDDMGRFDEAYEKHCAGIEAMREFATSEALAHNLHSFAHLLLKMQRYDEAVVIMSECVERRSKAFAADDVDYFYVCVSNSQLGEALIHQGSFMRAERCLLEAYKGFRAPIAPRWQKAVADRSQSNLERLVLLYTRWDEALPGQGYDRRAAEMAAQLEEFHNCQ